MFATSFFRWGYRTLLKPIYFRMDPEMVHDRMLGVGEILGRFRVTRWLTGALFSYANPILEQTVLGIRFPNPIGLSGGFDKNARITDILPSVGFGFVEVGSITGEPCSGNPKKRLWRLPKLKALVVNYGLANQGAEAIAARLKGKAFRCPIGMNMAKTNSQTCAMDGAGIEDHLKSMRLLEHIGDYDVINVSCPNAFGGQPFQTPEKMDRLLSALDTVQTAKPRFIKLGADVSPDDVDAIVTVAERHHVQGFVISNLTKKVERFGIAEELAKQGITTGGISGKPVRDLADNLIAAFYTRCGGRFVIIGCGGVFTAEDAYVKIRKGASLVQLITGMIYEGPQLIGEINRGLVALLKRDGYASIAEAVGADYRS